MGSVAKFVLDAMCCGNHIASSYYILRLLEILRQNLSCL